ncbi:MAG TPA: hypothetical protein ENI86_01145 [Acidimicrobiales bacterium]|nr:hypothetical protein [Acidimicrobiales bacterium]
MNVETSPGVNHDLKGQVLVDTEVVVDPDRLEMLSAAIGSATGKVTATLVALFGPTLAGQDSVIGPLGLDLRRTLQGGQSYEWHRPFRAGERVGVTIDVEDIVEKQSLDLITVRAVFRGSEGELIQRQRSVFVQMREATEPSTEATG